MANKVGQNSAKIPATWRQHVGRMLANGIPRGNFLHRNVTKWCRMANKVGRNSTKMLATWRQHVGKMLAKRDSAG